MRAKGRAALTASSAGAGGSERNRNMAGSRKSGFTLVEVLVVMSLLSLVMLAMGSALRTTAQTEERVDQFIVLYRAKVPCILPTSRPK